MQFGCGPVDLHIKPWNLGPIPADHFVSCWVSFLFEKKGMLTPTLSHSLSCFVMFCNFAWCGHVVLVTGIFDFSQQLVFHILVYYSCWVSI